MDRVILHCDLNNFYASVECRDEPSIRGIPVAVCGDPAQRHGIVLAKNNLAKARGVRTGEAIWEAKLKCPDLHLVPPHFDKYIKASRAARAIYTCYTDQVESFGIDECWLDITRTCRFFGGSEHVAAEIRRRIREEIGITASVGVSFNKIFAKLGSDLKKPDATTLISRENFRELVWGLDAGELLFVGRATGAKLRRLGIGTIGELARTPEKVLRENLGKNGSALWRYANGLDDSPVSRIGESPRIKSIGNSTTAPRDLVSDRDVRVALWALCESVAARLREANLRCSTVTLHLRDTSLFSFERQAPLSAPCCTADGIFSAAYSLFTANQRMSPLRSIGVRASGLTGTDVEQLSVYPEYERNLRQEELEKRIDRLREKYGPDIVRHGIVMTCPELAADRLLKPHGFML